MNDDLLKSGVDSLRSFLNTRTGFLGLGPTYGQILAGAAVAYLFRRYEEREVVKEAERVLEEVNERNRGF